MTEQLDRARVGVMVAANQGLYPTKSLKELEAVYRDALRLFVDAYEADPEPASDELRQAYEIAREQLGEER